MHAPSEVPAAADVLRDLQNDVNARCHSSTAALLSAWRTEATTLRFLQACIAELLATALLLATGVTAVIYSEPLAAGSEVIARTVLVSAVFGLVVFALVMSLSTSSGGHLNPCISLLLFLRGAVSFPRCMAYICMQLLGAIMGTSIARSLNTTLYDAMSAPACNRVNYGLAAGMTVWTAYGAELLGAALLSWVVLASGDVGTLPATRRSGALNPLAIGLAVFVAHLVLIPIDGCGLNPARSVGTAVVAGYYQDLWVFITAPCCGAVIALITYELFFFGRRTLPSHTRQERGVASAAMQAAASRAPITAGRTRRSPRDTSASGAAIFPEDAHEGPKYSS